MLLTSFITALTSVASVRPQAWRREAQTDPQGVLDELFAIWPLEAEEEWAVRARYTRH